ncbi:UPF0489 family protein [Paenibacillus thiaminolyticus]|nr:UPF0489 family protein [Paenibacillus thiaminolyticus]
MRSEWEYNVNWKVHTCDKRISIIRDHNWAYAAWEIARIERRINEKSLLVHVDAHLDDTPDGVLVKNATEAKTIEEIIEACSGYDYINGEISDSNLMQVANFIWPSLARKTIEEVIYVSRDQLEVCTVEELIKQDRSDILSKLPSDFSYNHKRFESMDLFFDEFDKSSFNEYVAGRTVILDIDIDIFNETDNIVYPTLTPMHAIRGYTQKLINLYPWDLITIAISPVYCGGSDEAELILGNVLKGMNPELINMNKW